MKYLQIVMSFVNMKLKHLVRTKHYMKVKHLVSMKDLEFQYLNKKVLDYPYLIYLENLYLSMINSPS